MKNADNLQEEIFALEEKYKNLKLFKADDEETNFELLKLRKQCLLSLITKQDEYMRVNSIYPKNDSPNIPSLG